MARLPELLSPAGSEAALNAAIQGGCDAVYFGIGPLNMRSTDTFPPEALPAISRQCRQAGIRAYLTLNTVLFDHELDSIRDLIQCAKQAGIHGVIVSDMAALLACREFGMEAHISTQLSVSNIQAVLFYSQFADRIVLARECTLTQIAAITEQIYSRHITGPSGRLLEIEVFAHGALCVAVSGRCGMSLHLHNRSANRGQCLQPCRRSYRVTDMENGHELEIDNHYVMSPKDLSTIHILDKIVESRATVLKLEGRTRSPEYVRMVTWAYRSALDALAAGHYSRTLTDSLEKELTKIYHRGYSQGFYLGMDADQWSGKYGSHATRRKIYCGKILNFFSKVSTAQVKLEAHALETGDELLIIGPTTGALSFPLENLRSNDLDVQRAVPGEEVTFIVPEKVRPNDRVYLYRKTGGEC